MAGSTDTVAGLPECLQGISAVKALGWQQWGQRTYTITPQVYANQPNIVNTALVAHSPSTRAKVQVALDEGKEVTIHEAPIAQSGWVGAGFTVIEEGTGAGAYTIEGGSNGGVLAWWEGNGTYVGLAVTLLSWIAVFLPVSFPIVVMLAALSIFVAFMNILIIDLQVMENNCPPRMSKFGRSVELFAFVAGFFGAPGVAVGSFLSFLTGGAIGSAVAACRR